MCRVFAILPFALRARSAIWWRGGRGDAFTRDLCAGRPIETFGFGTALEREWFRLLQSVQGVGAKVALVILSTLTAGELANAIALKDTAMVSRAWGG